MPTEIKDIKRVMQTAWSKFLDAEATVTEAQAREQRMNETTDADLRVKYQLNQDVR